MTSTPTPPAAPTAPLDRQAFYLALGCYAAWGIFPIYWKLLTHIPAAETLAHRIIWACAFYFLYVVIRGVWKHKPWQQVNLREWGMATLASSLLTVNWGVFIYAVNTDRILDASLAYFINPLMSVAVGVIWFREPFPPLLKFAFIMALLGVTVQIIGKGEIPWISLTLATSFCIYGVLKKMVRTEAGQFAFMESLVLLPPALIGAYWAHNAYAVSFTGLDWFWMAIGGAVTGIPILLFSMAAPRLPYSLMGIIQFIGPTLQFLIGMFIYKETLGTTGFISFAFIWAGVGLYLTDRIRVARKLRNASRVALATPEEPC